MGGSSLSLSLELIVPVGGGVVNTAGTKFSSRIRPAPCWGGRRVGGPGCPWHAHQLPSPNRAEHALARSSTARSIAIVASNSSSKVLPADCATNAASNSPQPASAMPGSVDSIATLAIASYVPGSARPSPVADRQTHLSLSVVSDGVGVDGPVDGLDAADGPPVRLDRSVTATPAITAATRAATVAATHGQITRRPGGADGWTDG